jgi:hypothetical protein
MSTEAQPVARVSPFRLLLAANATGNSAPSGTPDTTTAPSPGAGEPGEGRATGVIDLDLGGIAHPSLTITPVGVGDGQTADYYVFGWSKNAPLGGKTALWHRTLILLFRATFRSALPSVAADATNGGGGLGTGVFYADTLTDPTTGTGVLGVDCRKHAVSGHSASYELLVNGYAKAEVVPVVVTATQANALVRVGS